jgi:hypothetical protein
MKLVVVEEGREQSKSEEISTGGNGGNRDEFQKKLRFLR